MKANQPDYIMIFTVFALVVFGLVVLASASVVLSQDHFNESYYFLKHQLLYGLSLGLIAFFLCQKIHYRYWQRIAFPLIILGIILLVLVLIPGLGYSHSQAKRWIIFGPFSLQPFEFVKLSFIIYLAALLGREKRKKDQALKESIWPFLVVFAFIAVLVLLQPNLSALIITALIAGLIYFLAGIRMIYLFGASLLALAGIFALIKMAPYRIQRLTVFLHPEIDPQGIGYQINQALLAIGSGGLFGLGLGHSIQKWKYLPEPIGDSIFAIIGEELGFIGATLLIALFVFFAWRGLRIVRSAPDRFAYLLSGGIVGWIFFQAFINIAAISGLMPLTGMPLPFISYGGSALVVSLAGVGILVNISKFTKR